MFVFKESIFPSKLSVAALSFPPGKKPDSAFHGAVLLSHTNLGPKLIFWAAQAMLAEL
jgi:hypothetical protein